MRSDLLTAIARVLGASVVARIAGVVKGLVVAKILLPELYGVSGLVAMIVAYTQFADLGTGNVAFRELTAAVGRSDREEMARNARYLCALRLLSTALVAGACFAIGRLFPFSEPVRLGLTILPAIAISQASLQIMLLYFQAAGTTNAFSRTMSLNAIADAALGIGLTLRFGLAGLLAATAIAPTISLLYALLCGTVIRPQLPPWPILRRYLTAGVPFVGLGLLDYGLVYLDQVIVLRYLSVRDLGLYNIAMTIADVLRMIGIAAGTVLGPRLIRALSRAEGEIPAVRAHTLGPVGLFASGLPFIVTGLWFGGSFLIGRFYPSYEGAVRPMQLLLLAFYFLVVTGGVSSFLFAIDKHRKNLPILASAVVFNIGIDIVLLRAGGGLEAIALGSLCTFALYCLAHVIYVATHFAPSRREWARLLGVLLLPGAYMMLVLHFVDGFIGAASLGAALASCGLSLGLLLPLLLPAIRIAKRMEASE